MAIKVHYEKTAKIDPLKKSTVAVVGYGSQGHAHAQNLRDSGIKVIVGNHNRTSPNAKLALKHGFDVLPIADAVKAADVVMCTVPDEFLPETYAAEIEPNLKAGAMLMGVGSCCTAAILLIGRSRMLPQWIDGSFQPRLMMPLSISYDHRIVDGATAQRFLNDVKGYLASPGRLLLAP